MMYAYEGAFFVSPKQINLFLLKNRGGFSRFKADDKII